MKTGKFTSVLRPHSPEDAEQLNAAAKAFYFGRLTRPTLNGVIFTLYYLLLANVYPYNTDIFFLFLVLFRNFTLSPILPLNLGFFCISM